MMLISAFSEGRQWEDYLNESAEVEKITKEDIIRVANQYFTGNYLAFFSKMGFPKKDKITKPNWAPVIPKNTEKKSEFATQLNNIPDTKIEPRFVDFNKDLTISTLKPGIDFYYTNNPINTIFTLNLKFKVGPNSNSTIEAMANYMNFIGTKDKSIQEFRKALQNIGATFRISANSNYVELDIDGFESKLEPTLKLIAEFMTNPKADDKQLDKLVQGAKMEYKSLKADAESMSSVLNNYSMYKENSYYLKHLSIKETKKLKGEQLIALFKDVLQYECEIHYVGKLPIDDVKKAVGNSLPFGITPKPAVYIENAVIEASEPDTCLMNLDKRCDNPQTL
jgi:predicted Zn-dependent peptidase